jgi:Delta24-sterol reductase
MDRHEAAVVGIAERVRGFHALQKPFRLYHGSTNSTRPSQRNRDNTVDTSGLNHVLEIDTAAKTVTVEPNVPMDALVRATMARQLVPPVVMEFPGITVGGGFAGSSGESSSFRYGFFDATVNAIEIVLANGDITTASKTNKPDLFWGAASSFGTLGVVTKLEVQLVEAGPFVELTYHHVSDTAAYLSCLQNEVAKDSNDYVDAIVFSPTSTLVCTGKRVRDVPSGARIQRFLRRRDSWFYIHAERVIKRLRADHDTTTEYVPLEDYLFRYDRGGFWTARYAFRYFFTPFNRVTRFILDPVLHTRELYRAMHKAGLYELYLVQDVSIPMDKASEFQQWLQDSFGIYPLWLCPLQPQRPWPDANHGLHAEFGNPDTPRLLNFGVWGFISPERSESVRKNRLLERKVHELSGKKCLYAGAYYTEEEFWANYDRPAYDALRNKYSAAYLPSVFEKVSRDMDSVTAEQQRRSSWRDRLRGLYGVYQALAGGDYLLKSPRSSHTVAESK